MSLIDTHTHLASFAQRGELETVLARAAEAGVEAMITVGTDRDDWGLYRDIAAAHPARVHYTVGLHPCSVSADWVGQGGGTVEQACAQLVAELEAFFLPNEAAGADGAAAVGASEAATPKSQPRPVAIGECGLDRFHLPKDDPAQAEAIFAWQQTAFAAQLGLARRLGCPVEIHSRGAFRECVELIDASGVDWARVVFHCFSEGPAEMSELVARGGRGSFTGILTYKNAPNVRESARVQGLERLMLETDAPYLTPMPHRGKRPNEPAFLRHTAEFAAEFFGVSAADLTAITTCNARTFFNL
ncbi:hydrolase TatD [Cephaloticoccus primus]|uniref:Hydrolase TatD n=1 Tax=Cephaloticoccus primus TaxID=1548207 RepID=A0A139SKB8_9BACT|nr:TatD family hydrolase [Cephaloticoccus primus]KXU34940.1 hydrolase TatD [Cephaloticoccus primus]